MTSKLNGASSESKWCLFNRYHRLKRGEARARQQDRQWLNERQARRMLEEIGERAG